MNNLYPKGHKMVTSNLNIINKRGLSEVVTSLIMILLVLVAVAIVWIVIKNMLTESADEISITGFMVDMDIRDVKDNGNNIDVKIKREVGEGNLKGVRFIVDDGSTPEIIDNNNSLNELEEKSYNLNYSGLLKKVSIAPIFETEAGEEKIGGILDEKEFTNKEIIETIGGVAWYKFDGNANDELGNHNAIINGSPDCTVQGKYKQACEFNGVSSDKILTNKARSRFFDASQGTMMAWVRPKGGVVSNTQIYNLPSIICDEGNYLGIYIGNLSSKDGIWIYNKPGQSNKINISYINNNWVHTTWVHNFSHILAYKDGLLSNSIASGNTLTNSSLIIGNNNFSGTIDELMIFNRALSNEEIKGISNLDLS